MFLNLIKKYVAIAAFFIIFSAIISLPTLVIPHVGLVAGICIVAGVSVPVLAILHAIDNYVDTLTKKSNLT